MARLELPTVTLCAVTSVNVAATVEALRMSMRHVSFGDALLLTDSVRPPTAPTDLKVRPIERLNSARDYSRFVLQHLAEQIESEHCLIIQWDGFVLDPARWSPTFLQYDYIGAPWPQFRDGHNVGNGGFSLRSSKLLRACGDADFVPGHPEDVAICRTNRLWLERTHGIRFAPMEQAVQFSLERGSPSGPTFGFHGVFNLIPLLGADRFWEIYESLDDRATIAVDMWRLLRQLGLGRDSRRRQARLMLDGLKLGKVKEIRRAG